MVIDPQLRSLKSDPSCPGILFVGEGDRAFCAGGDVLHIAQSASEKSDWNRKWFSSEFLLNYMISTYTKPVVSIWKGIVMGGGVGLSIYGSHRVATETTMFAMPETSIGFFPDIGASFILSHYIKNPGLGLYLGMTGHRLTGSDVHACGLATHFVDSSKLTELRSALESTSDISGTVDQYSYHSSQGLTLNAEFLKSVETYFRDTTSFGDFFSRLRVGVNRKDPFALATMKTVWSKCPLTVRVWFESFTLGSRQTLPQVLEREYHMCIQVTEQDSHNFREGVRATLIDKGKGQPADYRPRTIEEVTDDMVAEIIGSNVGGDIGACIRENKLMY